MDDLFFSVIIPVFNREAVIARAVESVLSQTFVHYELIIVNDGSTDRTKNVIMSYSDSKIILIESLNRGVSHARNLGIRQSSGQYCTFLDSDDQWLPHKLERDAVFIRDNPGILIHQSDEYWVRNGMRVNKKRYHEKVSGDIFAESLVMCMISPSSVVMHRSLFTVAGLFDERMKVCEDYDLWLRITKDYPVGLIPEKTIVKYGGHPDQLSRSVDAIDRYRVYSLTKLIMSGKLPPEKQHLAEAELARKCGILKAGAKKRLNAELYEKASAILNALGKDSTLPDATSLLEE
ncbi:MAG: glycosyltransferase family 2 protein [Spirochaetota bacterium]